MKKLFLRLKKSYFVYFLYKYLSGFLFRLISFNLKKIFLYYPQIKIRKIVSLPTTIFFGYYNISPWNILGDLTFIVLNDRHLLPSRKNIAQIYIKRHNNINPEIVGSTNAWNWQQGCMLQWFSNNQVIYNDYNKKTNKLVSVILNIDNKAKEYIPFPIYSLSKNRKFALSLYFDRLTKLRPDYGYIYQKEVQLKSDNEDGLVYIDIEKKEFFLLKSIHEIYSFNKNRSMNNALHKINHIELDPTDSKALFLHRWFSNGTKFTRLMTIDILSKELSVIHGDKMVSHCCWLSSYEILSFCFYPGFGNRYVIFNIKTGDHIILDKLPHVDGHPSKSPTSEWIVTDKYPDKQRMSSLYIYNLITKELILIGKFYQPPYFVKTNRIDLHPKWSPDGSKIAFESGHSGRRNLYYIDVSYLIDKK